MSSLINRINLFAKKFNAEKYLKDRKLQFNEVDSSNGIQLNVEVCPFCKNKNYKGNFHPYRLYIRSDDKRFLCYNCSAKGNIIALLAQYESLSERSVVDKYIFGDYVDLLPDELKVVILDSSSLEEDRKSLEPIELPISFQTLLPLGPHLTEADRYLSKRGLLDPEVIKMFDIRFCKDDLLSWGDKKLHLHDRIVFPIYFDGKCYGWQGRDITDQQEPKYLLSKDFQKQQILFNYENIKDKEFITITEGPIDAIKSHKINGTCLFGKALSATQERYLLRCPNLKSIYMCLDNYDPKAVISQEEIAKRLSSFFDVFIIHLPLGKDAGAMSFDDMVLYKNQAVRYNTDKLTSLLV